MRSSWRLSQSRKKGLWILFLILTLIIGFRWWTISIHPSSPPLPTPPDHFLIEGISSFDTLDVNLASAEDFQQFSGIGKVLSERILKFRTAKGGFHNIEEVQQVYGIQDSVFQKMKPYLVLTSPPSRKTYSYPAKRKALYTQVSPAPIDINMADSSEWASLPGIGPVLSKRIINYRKARNGFTSLEDVSSVYGLSEDTYQKIIPYLLIDELAVSQKAPPQETVMVFRSISPESEERYSSRKPNKLIPIDLNLADSAQLEALPGIGPKLARRILHYRNIIGFYSQLEFLHKVYGLKGKHFLAASPYLYVHDLPPPTLDLNTVSRKKLGYLPFVEEETVNRFYEERKNIGRFQDWEEFQQLMGISVEELGVWKAYFKL
ncbi:MAG: helix-hairpin-helix domain-containing protein [Bacteroidota bacterium]